MNIFDFMCKTINLYTMKRISVQIVIAFIFVRSLSRMFRFKLLQKIGFSTYKKTPLEF